MHIISEKTKKRKEFFAENENAFSQSPKTRFGEGRKRDFTTCENVFSFSVCPNSHINDSDRWIIR
jgi:hypothetical protein